MKPGTLPIIAMLLLGLGLGPGSPPVMGQQTANDHFAKAGELLKANDFAAALAEYEETNELKADQPEVYFGMSACLNALGKYAEAKEKIQTAFKLLKNRPKIVGSNWGPIDIGYYALLADIQANLNEFEAAVETVKSFEPPAGPARAQTLETLNVVKKNITAKLLAGAGKCLTDADIACARRAIAAEESLQPMAPDAITSLVRMDLSQVDRMNGTSDEEKAKRAELDKFAIELLKRLPPADAAAPDAKRLLGRALAGSDNAAERQEGIRMLSALAEPAGGQPPADPSVMLDLASAYTGGDDWDAAVNTLSNYLKIAPESARSQAYCQRAYAYYKMAQYQNALDDGTKCVDADGNQRNPKLVEAAKHEIQRQKDAAAAAAAAAASRDSGVIDCRQLNQEILWVRMNPNPELDSLVPIISHFESGKSGCAGSIEPTDTAALCQAGAYSAANPVNLSMATPEDLKALDASTRKYLKVCGSYLNDQQKAAIAEALNRIGANK